MVVGFLCRISRLFFIFFIHEFKSIQIEKEDFLVFNNEENPL